jgi:negative regulator of sigma E activity
LRAIDSADAQQADRVIAAAMSRISASPDQYPRDTVVALAERFTRPALVAAAVLAAVAIGTVAFTNARRERDSSPEASQVATLASWAESQHVPTNGELLLAFQGYRP